MSFLSDRRGKGAVSVPDLKVKFVFNHLIHEGAWEGSCRFGDLEDLTQEAERAAFENGFAAFKRELASHRFPAGVTALEPAGTHLYVEEGNPLIMLKDEQLAQLDADADQTDVYAVFGGGISQYTCLRIAERFNKPVIIVNEKGWAIDAPAGLRSQGYDGFYVQNFEQLDTLLNLFRVKKAFANTRLLRVTNFPGTPPRGVISAVRSLDALREQYGIEHTHLDYEQFFGTMDELTARDDVRGEAENLARALLDKAKGTNMTREDVVNSVLFYLTVRRVLEEQGCNAFTIECFEMCSSLNPQRRRFTPCLTNALLKDSGIPGACEGDVNAALSQMALSWLSGKAAYMGNPDFDLAASGLALHHSVASLKMFGFDAEETGYFLQAFTKQGFGATLRHDFSGHVGEEVTVARFSPDGTRMLAAAGKVSDGSGIEGLGCAQQVYIKVPDAKALMRAQQNYGHHLTMVYGNYLEELRDLADVLHFTLEVV